MNGTFQLLVYAGDVNILGTDVYTTKKMPQKPFYWLVVRLVYK